MALTTFIPELWSARLQAALEKNLVALNLVNRDYEGQISEQGDTVHINTISNVSIKKYTKGSAIDAPETLTTTDTTLEITEADYFNFAVNDVDAAQAAGDPMDKAMTTAAYGLSDAADSYIFGVMASGGTAVSSSAVALTASNVYQTIVSMRTKLDKLNVPTQGRWAVVPPEAYALLLLDDRFVKTGGTNAEQVLRTGYVGNVAGFEIFESNNCPYDSSASAFTLLAGVNAACTYADQINKTEAFRPEADFSDAVKGLHLYGAKITDAAQIVTQKVTV